MGVIIPMAPSVGIIIYQSRLKIHSPIWGWSGWGVDRLRMNPWCGARLASAAERAPSRQGQNSRFGSYGAIGLPPTHRTKRDEWGTHIVDVPLKGWASRRGPQGLKP